MGCYFLLQGIFLTQGWNPSVPHCRQTVYCLNYQESPRDLSWSPEAVITCHPLHGGNFSSFIRFGAVQGGRSIPKITWLAPNEKTHLIHSQLSSWTALHPVWSPLPDLLISRLIPPLSGESHSSLRLFCLDNTPALSSLRWLTILPTWMAAQNSAMFTVCFYKVNEWMQGPCSFKNCSLRMQSDPGPGYMVMIITWF